MKLSRTIDAIICGFLLMLIWNVTIMTPGNSGFNIAILTPDNSSLGAIVIKCVISCAVIFIFVKYSLLSIPDRIVDFIVDIFHSIVGGTKAFLVWGIGTDVETLSNITDRAAIIDKSFTCYQEARSALTYGWDFSRRICLTSLLNSVFTVITGVYLCWYSKQLEFAVLIILAIWFTYVINHLSHIGYDSTLRSFTAFVLVVQALLLIFCTLYMVIDFFDPSQQYDSNFWTREIFDISICDQNISVSLLLICIVTCFIMMLIFFAQACATAHAIGNYRFLLNVDNRRYQEEEAEEEPEEEEEEEPEEEGDDSNPDTLQTGTQPHPVVRHTITLPPIPATERNALTWPVKDDDEIVYLLRTRNYPSLRWADPSIPLVASYGHIISVLSIEDQHLDVISKTDEILHTGAIELDDIDSTDPYLMTLEEYKYFRIHPNEFQPWAEASGIPGIRLVPTFYAVDSE